MIAISYTHNTDAHRRGNNKYLKTKVDSISVRLPKGTKDRISHLAKDQGISINKYTSMIIRQYLQDHKISSPISPL